MMLPMIIVMVIVKVMVIVMIVRVVVAVFSQKCQKEYPVGGQGSAHVEEAKGQQRG